MKICTTCKIQKDLLGFYKNSKGSFGVQEICKCCVKLRNQKDREKISKRTKIYEQKNKVKIAARKKSYRQRTKETKNKYIKQRLQTDINFRLRHVLRGRIQSALKSKSIKVGSVIRDLGCSIEELKQYLESKFKDGMTWENYGFEGWHIDHIKPLASFDLTIREEFLKACHYTNLQPLWAEDNYRKGKRTFI